MPLIHTDPFDTNKTIVEKNTYIRVNGGDGMLLRAINKLSHLNKPFFGVAGGTVNFLMNNSTIISDEKAVHKFNLLTIEVNYIMHEFGTDHETVVSDTFHAFNDLVLGSFNGWVEFNCQHKDQQLGTFKGSGLIVSTAQGSTGINRNNNGTILPLSSPNWSVTGMQTNRTINSVLAPSELSIDVSARAPVSIAIDGTNHVIDNVTSVTVTQGSTVEVIFNDFNEFQRKRQ